MAHHQGNARGLVAAAAKDSGLSLPWNLCEYGQWDNETACVAFAGWIRELNRFKAIQRVLRRTQSAGGMNSPYTTIDLWDMFRKYPRVLEFEKKLWQTKERAERIQSAFGSQTPSWKLIAHALMHTPDQHRAGLIAAAGTLAHGPFSTTREAKAFLVRYHLCKQVDTSNQKQTMIDPIERHEERIGSYDFARVYLAMGVVPFRPYAGDPEPLRFWWLVKSNGGRAFHYALRQSKCGVSYEAMPKKAIQAAKKAWAEQDKFLAENPDIAHFIMNGGEVTPEVWKGNSRLAIKHFITEQRWSEMESFPARWLLPYLPMESNYQMWTCAVKQCLREAWRRMHPLRSPKQELPQKVHMSEHVAVVKEAGVKFKPSAWIQAERCENDRAISGGASIFIGDCRASDTMAKLIKVQVRDLLFERTVSHTDLAALIKRLGYQTAEAADTLRFAGQYDGDEEITFVTDEVADNGSVPWLYSGEHTKRIGLRFIDKGYSPDDVIVFRAPKGAVVGKVAA